MRNTTLAIATKMARVSKNQTPRLKNGTEKQKNKNLPEHGILVITIRMTLKGHILMRQNGSEKLRNKGKQMHNVILVIAIKMDMVLNNQMKRL